MYRLVKQTFHVFAIINNKVVETNILFEMIPKNAAMKAFASIKEDDNLSEVYLMVVDFEKNNRIVYYCREVTLKSPIGLGTDLITSRLVVTEVTESCNEYATLMNHTINSE